MQQQWESNHAMKYQIEKNIPLPKARIANHIWKDMEIGDSVFIPTEQTASSRASYYRFARLNNVKFVSKTENYGIRVWRIK